MLNRSLSALSDGFSRAGEFVRTLAGIRRFAFAMAMGLLSALAFEPVNFFPFLLVGFGALVLLIDGAKTHARPIRSAAFAGWVFGFGYFFAGLYWVGYAFMVDAAAHEWQLPLVAIVFPGGLALFPAFACALAGVFWKPGSLSRIFLLAAAYGLAEWLRGHILTGFPWNIPGYAWGAEPGLLQVVSAIGIYGLSLLTLLLGASLALFFEPVATREWRLPLAAALVFLLLNAAGNARLVSTPTGFVPGVKLRIVQPNVAQADKYVVGERAAHWRDLVVLSVEKHGPPPTHIIWPESAPPFLLAREPEALDDVAALTAGNRVLMTGALRAEVVPGEAPVFFNSFYIFSHGGELIGTYNKFHLVPFGEYLPLEPLLSALGLAKIVGIGSFRAGDGPHSFAIPGAPDIGPLICYEIIFPGAVTGKRRPGWFVNVTDDSWFGPPGSAGPVQHFLIARVRAIEEGIPVARAANTGISAVIDPLGRVIAQLGAGKKGIVDAGLPRAEPETLFARFGDGPFWLMLLLSAAAGLLIARRNGT